MKSKVKRKTRSHELRLRKPDRQSDRPRLEVLEDRWLMNAGDLDLTFDSDGKVTTPIQSSTDEVRALAIQSDGKIIAAGRSNGSNYDFALARYNTNGSLDTSFDTDGKVTTPIGTSTDEIYAIAIQPDGKIVVAGRASIGGNYDFALARYNANGSLDTTFDGDGKVTTTISSSNTDEAYSIAIQPDGKIVVGGRARMSNYDFAVVRYNSNGSLDTTFDTDGKVTTPIGSRNDDVYAMVIQPDGKIVVAGRSRNSSNYDFALARYNANGSLDTSFDTDGKLVTTIGTSTDEAYALVLQSDGKLVAAGRATIGSTTDFALVRYNSNGSLDTTFDSDGKVTTTIGTTTDEAYALALQNDGKLVAAGRAYNGANYDFALVRYRSNGSLDTGFDTDGKVITTIGTSTDEVYALAIQSDRKIVAAGRSLGSNQDFALARYESNTAPVAAANSYFVNEDGTLSVTAPGILGNDTDADGDPLTAVLVGGPASGSLSLAVDGSFTYTPNANFSGNDSFTYKANDGVADSNTVTVTITVNPINDAPVSTDDAYGLNEDNTLNVSAPGVIGNDFDVDGDPLTAVLVSGTTNGSLSLNANGSFSYTPNANFNGTDSFRYQVSDGVVSSGVATVTLTVNAVNDAPSAGNDAYGVAENNTLTVSAPGVLANDTDVEGSPLTAVLVSGPLNGILTFNANGSFVYTPTPFYFGPDSFTYRANDGVLNSNVATVAITVGPVNDPPVAGNDSYGVDEDNTLIVSAPGVLGNDSDIEGDPLTAVLVSGPSKGSLTLNANGSFSYTPSANFTGTDSFRYQASDGTSNSNVATVTITVNPINDAPTAVNNTYGVSEDNTLNVAAPGVLGNDNDVDGDPLTAILVSSPANGSLTFNANGSFSYTPNLNFNGNDSFTYQNSDGLLQSNLATVTITVNAVNDAPVAAGDSYVVAEDNTLTVGAPGVLVNDSDVEGDPLVAILVGGPANGSVSLFANGSFNYTPNANFTGTDSFSYRASDGPLSSNLATVTITVTAVNDAPTAVDDAYGVNENLTLNVPTPGVLTNDTDVDGDPITAVLVTGPSNGLLTLNAGGSFTYVPNFNFNGLDVFTYRASDGSLNSNVATVVIDVHSTNSGPTASDDVYGVNEDNTLIVTLPGVLSNDSDPEDDQLTAILVTGPTNGSLSLNSSGSFSYTPNANYNGTDSFTYKANDGLLDSNVATVTITINAVNDAPIAVDDSYNATEDNTLTIVAPGVLGNDSDVEGSPLTALLVAGPGNGSLSLNANGSFVYTPNANFNGTDSFTYRANDGAANSNVATVTITVNAVNDAPVAANDSYSVNEDGSLTASAPGVITNDNDVDGDPLTAALVSGPSNGGLVLNANGSFVYTPNANFNGNDSFTYRVNDGVLNSNVATVSITVNAVNDAPVAANDGYSVNEDNSLSIAAPGVLGNDSDVDGNPLTAILVAGPANGALTLNANGSFLYVPNANFNGTDSFTYNANDGTVNSNVATVTITVNPVNDAPVAANDSYSVNEDGTLSVVAPGVLGNDSDIDGDPLTAVLVTAPVNGSLSLNANGSFNYVPNANFNGSDTFTYQANDGSLNSGIVTVSIKVNPVNDAPVASNDAYSVNEDSTLNVAIPGVLANDSDVDGDPLTAVLVSSSSNGTLILNVNGSFSYSPNANFNGTDSFTYRANDGTVDSNLATVAITVNAVNDAPVAANDSFGVGEDGSLTVTAPGVLANDSDVDGDPLTAVLVGAPASGSLSLNANGSFTYTPNANFNGNDSFTYRANDGTASSNLATVTITVSPVNDAPVAVNDSYIVNEDSTLNVAVPGVLGNDSDVDGDPLSAVLFVGPTRGTLTINADGSFSYTPNANFFGADSFMYKTNDGTIDSNVAIVTITVSAVNDAPVAANDSFSVNEDSGLTVAAPGVLGNDSDIDGDPLAAVLVAAPANGSLTLNANGSFTYTPNANFFGGDSFTYKANDGAADSNVATVSITVNSVNDAPVAANDSYSVNEDNSLNVSAPGVLGNDGDVDGDPITAVLVTGPANGSLTFNADGSFTYTPNANYNGGDSFAYKANDGTADSSVATVSITINPVNDSPVAADESYSTNEDVPLNVSAPGVLGNDSDIDGDPLAAVLVSGPTSGTLTLNANGSFNYTPNANFNGNDSFAYKANDGAADSNVASVSITVNSVNDAPVAANDSYSVNEDNSLNVSAPGVLGNDSDVEGDPISAFLVSGPASGTLILNADGSFTYTPNANFSGVVSFTYRANDGAANSNLATVTITVNPVNDAPVAANDSYSVNEDNVLTVAAPGVLGNDSDVDGDPLAAVLVAGPASGTLTLNANGSFTYTPSANFNGSDSFTYQANDGTADSNVATVSITVAAVNDAPVAVNDGYSVNEDATLNVAAPGVLVNDSDVDGNPLTATLVSGPAGGSLTLNANGSFTYTPNANYFGNDSFTYKANDGTADSNVATVSITVNSVNDAPVAANDSYSVNEDNALTVAAPGVLGNDSDVDGDPLAAVLVAGPASGILTLNANGSFTYTPNANFFGSDSFTYQANDGTADSNVATVSIAVNPVNDAPVAADDSFSMNEDGSLTAVAPGVLGNDSDVDGDPLTAVLVGGPASGSLTLNANGSFNYTPNSNFNGIDSFTYRANDGTANSNVATVTITVNPINDAPTAANDSFSVNEDATLNVAAPGVLGNDSDVDGDPLTAILIGGTANGSLTLYANGSFIYVPNANFNGTDSFSYLANDGLLDSNIATVTITVNPVNDAPVAANDSFGVNEDSVLNVSASGVLGNDSDIDGDVLSAVLVGAPSSGMLTLNANGSFSYTPNANFFGGDSFTYRANDGTANSNVATVSITVNAVNDAPVAANDSFSVNEDSLLSIVAPGVLVNDSDVEGDSLTAFLVSGPGNGTLTFNADGSFSYTPGLNFNGVDTFTYRANDGAANSNAATVTITVNAVNDAPIAANDSYSVNEDNALIIAPPGVLANDSDVDGDPLTANLVVGPSNGSLTLNANGSFTYTPNANFNGADSFTYRANDGSANSNVATVSITVNPVNDAPTATGDAYGVNEDAVLNVAAPGVLANDSDVDGNPLTAVLVTGPVNGSLTLNADGSLTYTPNVNFNGGDSFTYKATDGSADSNVATVSITVNPVNDAPVASNDSYNVNEDATLNVAALGVLGNDSDVDGDSLTAVLVSAPANGALTVNADGSFTYAPNANFFGSDSFTYKANDGSLDSNVATVSIAINPVNDAPVATNDSYSVNEDSTLNVAIPGVLGNDSDVDGDSLSAVLVSGPASGSLTLNANGSLSYTPNANFFGNDSFTYRAFDGSASSSVATVSITVNAVNDAPVAANDSYSANEDGTLTVSSPGVLGNDSDLEGDPISAVLVSGPANGSLTLNADGSFTYTPTANFFGSDSFTYRAFDGSLNSNAATVTIAVNPVNDPPSASNDSYSLNEDNTLVVAVPGVLANDTDIDGDPLSAVLVSGSVNGVVALFANGSFVYTPGANFFGSDSFSYRVSDGSANSNVATVTITVNPVNDAPVAANDSYSVNEDNSLNVPASGVLANDSDVEGDSLSAALMSGPANGNLTLNADGSFSYTPNANFFGSDSFTYRANDGSANSPVGTVSITVNGLNDVPVAADDGYTIAEDNTLTVTAPGLVGNDSDPDGDVLAAILVSGPANGTLTLNADGSLSYAPSANYFGVDSFTYKVNDGALDSNVADVTITVDPVNDAPVAGNDSASVDEDGTLTVVAPGVLANDSDVEGDTLSAVLVAGPANGTLTLNPDGSFTYTPNMNFFGTDSFTYKANDGLADSNVASVSITVNAVSDAPVAVNDSGTIDEDAILTVTAAGVLVNDSDVDGDSLSGVLVSGPANGTLTLNADGSYTYTPNANFHGTDFFTYKANDGLLDSNVASVVITVNSVNDPPVLSVPGNQSVNEGQSLSFTVSGTDVDGDTLTFGATGLPAGASFNSATQSFSWSPTFSQSGNYSVSFNVSDGNGGSDLKSVSITVNNVNRPPTANAGPDQTVDGTLSGGGSVTLTGSGSDPDGNPITYKWTEGAVLLSTQAAPLLNLSYGLHTLTLTVTDSLGASATDSMTVTVTDLKGPRITDVQFVTYGKSILYLNLKANEALDPVGAATVGNYALASAGKDRKIGTADDMNVALVAALYDAATQTVRLSPVTLLKQRTIYKLTVLGTGNLTDLAGNKLDGNMDGTPGDNCVVGIARGTSLRFLDSNGDSISLKLAGGGAMEMAIGLNGDPLHLRLRDTVAGVSTLTGKVKKGLAGDGVAKVKLASGMNGANNNLLSPPVILESISAAVVDLLLTSGGI